MNVKGMLDRQGISHRPSGTENVSFQCPACGRENKASANKDSGAWHCFVCEEKGGYRDLLETINRGEFVVNGMRNRDIVRSLYGNQQNPDARRRAASQVTRKLRMLRAHGIIKKVPRTHRYVVTARGKAATSAALKLQAISLGQLNDIAA